MESDMKKVQPKEGESANIVSENLERLKELFPEAFNEGGIDFDVLRQLLGDAKILDEGKEKHGLNWHGKKKARQIALTPSTGTLLPCPEESVDWDTTQNVFIEGDNLEVLKLLQRSYSNKVKMIYIDPPYNTGKEFIYPDKFQDNLDTYLKYTGQADGNGTKFSSNTETNGRKHTNWLNMMYPRLKLARNFMRNDGVIFISIDDNEVSNLRKLCDEVFGEENFMANIVWQKKYAATNDAKGFSNLHDHIIVYRKSESFNRNLLPRTEEQNKPYKNDDHDGRGLWRSDNLLVKSFSDSGVFPITNPSTGKEYLPPKGSCWRGSKETIKKWLDENRIFFGKDDTGAPQLKRYLNEVQDGRVPTTWWPFSEVGHNDAASKEVRILFGSKPPFDTPKPTSLIRQMIQISSSEDDIVMDFFAGSGTTGHSVLLKNVEDRMRRKFILVQLPETTSEKSDAFKQGYKNIADVSKERLRRASQKIRTDNPEFDGDMGFKVFVLARSNINAWNPDRSDLEETLLAHQEHLIEGRSEQDILYELLLKRGIDLAVPVGSRQAAGKTIYSIGHGALFACLDESITSDQVEEVAQAVVEWYRELAPEDTHVFFRDSAFTDDVSKTNMAAILEQNDITHVRSL